jgi:hypothetical protein
MIATTPRKERATDLIQLHKVKISQAFFVCFLLFGSFGSINTGYEYDFDKQTNKTPQSLI